MSFCQKKKIFCLIFFAIDFLRYQINDKLAFPLLLRGLEHTENWTKLNRVELKEDIATPDILNPEVKKFEKNLKKIIFFNFFFFSKNIKKKFHDFFATPFKNIESKFMKLVFFQDLLNAATNDNFETLDELESAHYLYPVDIKKVLTNDDLRTVVCRNF